MPFLTEPEPERDVMQPVLPGVSRVVAANPGPMTYHGTNTYLIDTTDGLVVLDPGPDDPVHVEAVMRATGGQVALILLSHTHHDHVGAAPALQEATGAPTAGFRESGLATFEADIKLADGDTIAGMLALHTPGHASDHLCFALNALDGIEGAVQRRPRDVVVIERGQSAGRRHGGIFRQPAHPAGARRRGVPARPWAETAASRATWCASCCTTEWRASVRSRRHSGCGAANTYTLMDTLYSQVHPRLRRAAERNVLAHLLKLEGEGKVMRDGEVWRAA